MNKFIKFIVLSHEDEPQTSEDLLDVIREEPDKPTKQTPMILSIDSIEKIYEHPIFSDLTEICTFGGEIIPIDESYPSFEKRFLVASGQEEDLTWSEMQTEDKAHNIRVYHN